MCHVGRPGHRQRCFLPIGERRRRPRLDRGARVGPTTACSGDAAATSRHLDAPPAPRRSKGRASVVGRPSKCAFVPSSSVCPAPQEARRLSPRDDDDVPVIGVCRPSLSREHRTPFPRHRRPSTWRSKAAPRRRPATAAVKVIFAAGQQLACFPGLLAPRVSRWLGPHLVWVGFTAVAGQLAGATDLGSPLGYIADLRTVAWLHIIFPSGRLSVFACDKPLVLQYAHSSSSSPSSVVFLVCSFRLAAPWCRSVSLAHLKCLFCAQLTSFRTLGVRISFQ